MNTELQKSVSLMETRNFRETIFDDPSLEFPIKVNGGCSLFIFSKLIGGYERYVQFIAKDIPKAKEIYIASYICILNISERLQKYEDFIFDRVYANHNYLDFKMLEKKLE